MFAIIIDIVALNHIGDVRRSAIHPFLAHLKKYQLYRRYTVARLASFHSPRCRALHSRINVLK